MAVMEFALEADVEELLVSTFKKISPSDIVKSKVNNHGSTHQVSGWTNTEIDISNQLQRVS
jgi:hypothetical protein